jgi:hypothetical protein
MVRKNVAGRIRSDHGRPVDGAWVSVRKLGSHGANLADGWVVIGDDPYHERAVTDARGQFRVAHDRTGWYRIDVQADGHFSRAWAVYVDRRSSTPGLSLELRADPHAVTPPPIVVREVGVVDVTGTGGRIGDVILELGADDASVQSGDPALAVAAIAHLRSWQYERTRPEPIRVTYRFRRGPAHVVADMPHVVEVWR